MTNVIGLLLKNELNVVNIQIVSNYLNLKYKNNIK